ncbi:MAG: SagB/ThcOx family dehydrogenase [Gammaproteobacteria bacterium]|nr:SagB/ThcOx family dehydrogenase [Gammaproteobacteria bacterium]
MKNFVASIIIASMVLPGCAFNNAVEVAASTELLIVLPEPRKTSEVPVEQALTTRRSIREFKHQPLTLAEVSQLLWAAQGITGVRFRTAPSAGGLYPLELYLVAGDVEGLAAGVCRYEPETHSLKPILEGDVRKSLARAAYWQEWVGNGAIALVFAAVYERTTQKYGPRGRQYAHMEAGHAAQNVYLQAEALGLGTVIVGAFMDSWVHSLLHMNDDEQPLSIMPVGNK